MTAYNVINAASMAAGQPEDVSVVLANLQAIAAILNGSLDDTNLSPSAALAASKIAGYPGDVAKVLKGDGTWGTIDPVTGYGTALPASPTDGREYILVDSVTAPTYWWRFRYNAGSTSPNKWEYIGGIPGYSGVETSESMSGPTGVDLATVGPSFTVPRAGDYQVELTCRVDKGTAAGWSTPTMYLLANGAVTTPLIQCYGSVYNTGGASPAPFVTMSDRGKTPLPASAALKAFYAVQAADTPSHVVFFSRRRMMVTPVRVA
jgi:hypothetical protein